MPKLKNRYVSPRLLENRNCQFQSCEGPRAENTDSKPKPAHPESKILKLQASGRRKLYTTNAACDNPSCADPSSCCTHMRSGVMHNTLTMGIPFSSSMSWFFGKTRGLVLSPTRRHRGRHNTYREPHILRGLGEAFKGGQSKSGSLLG